MSSIEQPNLFEENAFNATVTANQDTKATPLVRGGFTTLGYILDVSSVSGTSPTLDIWLLAKSVSGVWIRIHQIGGGQITADTTTYSSINANFNTYALEFVVGGTSPSFTVKIDFTWKR